MAWEERMSLIERNSKSKLKQKLQTPTSLDNSIKMGAVVVSCINKLIKQYKFWHSLNKQPVIAFNCKPKLDYNYSQTCIR